MRASREACQRLVKELHKLWSLSESVGASLECLEPVGASGSSLSQTFHKPLTSLSHKPLTSLSQASHKALTRRSHRNLTQISET